MSNGVPRSSYDPRRIFLFNLPKLNLGGKGRDIGTYIAGGLVSLPFAISFLSPLHLSNSLWINLTSSDEQFAASFFLLIDASTISSHAQPPPDAPYDTVPVRISFTDWIPAIFSTCMSFFLLFFPDINALLILVNLVGKQWAT